MPITRLTLTDFRSYEAMTIAPGAGFVVLIGDNGAGKTNLLEALSLLTPGRGLRGASFGEMARADGPGGFGVAARIEDHVDLATGTMANAPDRRQVRINGASASINALSEWLSVLWLTPAMDRLFSASPGERRRFLDRLVLALDPAHARRSSRFEAALRARNKLLAEPTSGWDIGWLDALEAQMSELGEAISLARLQVVQALAEQTRVEDGADFPASSLRISNVAQDDLRSRLQASRARDAAAGRATQGPQTEDLAVRYIEKDRPASQCSTGEQKALLLGIVLAHAELVRGRRGASPILLLDEVAAHLDPGRRAALSERLNGKGQVWMTGTEAGLFNHLPGAEHFVVAGGTITPL